MENKIFSFEQFSSIYESEFYLGESESSGIELDFDVDNLGVEPDELSDVMANLDAKPLKEATPAKTGTVNPFRPIVMGETGERVGILQQILGFPEKDVDKIFGNQTKRAVENFQRKYGIRIDGKVGDQTMLKMIEVIRIPAQKVAVLKEIPVKTATDAAKAGIDPRLLDLYDIFVTNDGKQQRVILIPKPGCKEKANQMKKSGISKGLEMLIEGVNYLGRAIVLTAKGLFIISLEAAKGIIRGLASIGKMVARGIAFAVGAIVAGFTKFAEWISKMGQKAWQGIKDATDQIWKEVCEAVAFLGRAALGILYAFMEAVKTVSYTLAGMALKFWKLLKQQFDKKIQQTIEICNKVEDFTKTALKELGAKVQETKRLIADGYKIARDQTVKAYSDSKQAISKFGNETVKKTKEAYDGVMKFLQDSYDEGKKAVTESMFDIYGSEFLYENHQLLEFEEIDFSLEYDWRW